MVSIDLSKTTTYHSNLVKDFEEEARRLAKEKQISFRAFQSFRERWHKYEKSCTILGCEKQAADNYLLVKNMAIFKEVEYFESVVNKAASDVHHGNGCSIERFRLIESSWPDYVQNAQFIKGCPDYRTQKNFNYLRCCLGVPFGNQTKAEAYQS